MRLNVNTPCSGLRLILLLHFLAEPLTAAKPVAALHGSFVFRYDCSDSFLEEGREPQGHAVNLDQGGGEGETERGRLYVTITSGLKPKSKYLACPSPPLSVYLVCRLSRWRISAGCLYTALQGSHILLLPASASQSPSPWACR